MGGPFCEDSAHVGAIGSALEPLQRKQPSPSELSMPLCVTLIEWSCSKDDTKSPLEALEAPFYQPLDAQRPLCNSDSTCDAPFERRRVLWVASFY